MKLYSLRRGFLHRVHCRRLSPLSTRMRSLRRELLFGRCANETSSRNRPNATPGVLIAAPTTTVLTTVLRTIVDTVRPTRSLWVEAWHENQTVRTACCARVCGAGECLGAGVSGYPAWHE